jgi:hypothetical protein
VTTPRTVDLYKDAHHATGQGPEAGVYLESERGITVTPRYELCAFLSLLMNKDSMLSRVCHGDVAVVGNGPLTPQDRERINGPEFDCIVRFNDRKNMKEHDRTTIHAVRDIPERNNSLLSWLFRGEQRIVPGLLPGENVFVQPVTARPDKIHDKFVNTTMLLPPMLIREHGSDVASETYFPSCELCRSGEYDCRTSATRSGPSTGAVLINALEAQPSTTSIHVFGMNWNGGDHHIDFKQPNLVSDCCSKCTVHPTANASYA